MTAFNCFFERNIDSMDSLADEICELLQSKVTIEDDHHNVLGYSSHQDESDPARISTIISRRVPNSVIAGLRKYGIMKQLESTPKPVWIPAINEIGLGDRLAICIKNQNAVLGYIWVVIKDDFDREGAEQVIIMAAGIAKRLLLKRHSRIIKKEQMYDEFFWKLLAGDYDSEEGIDREADAIKITLPEAFHIFVIEFDCMIDDQTLAQFHQKLLTLHQATLIFLSTSNAQVIGLVAVNKPGSGKARVISFVEAFKAYILEKGECCIVAEGCSAACNSYLQANKVYQEALSVLSIKKSFPYHTRNLMFMDDMGFFSYVPMIKKLKKENNYSNPFLDRLRQYDRDNKSDLIRTLAVFLSFNSNLKESAAFLHIHANTLTYRLNRIVEITGRSLKDMNYLASIYIDLLTEETASINEWFAIKRSERN